MAVNLNVLSISMIAEDDMSDFQYRYIGISTTEGYCKLLDSTSEEILGVLQNSPSEGQSATIMLFGISLVVASESLNCGTVVDAEYISGTDSGKAIPFQSGGQRLGIVLRSASQENKYASILLKNN